MRHRLTIAIAGAGGDGVVLLGSLLQRLCASIGYCGQMPRYYGPQIRGGASAVKLSLDAGQAAVPADTADITICFNWEKDIELEQEMALGNYSVLFYEDSPPKEGIVLPEKSFQVGVSEISNQLIGKASSKNLVALGLLERILALPESLSRGTEIEDEASALLEKNRPALDAGRRLLLESAFSELRLSPPQNPSPKVVLDGNSAVARGAIRVGCRAFFGYPITPASEIMEEMQERLNHGNGVFLQAEDEIAAIGMALGASLTGAKSLSAYDLEGCYRILKDSFNISERYQTPVILISDQRLGQTTGATDRSMLETDYAIVERKRPGGEYREQYRRYEKTDDHISPMASAGDEGTIYQVTGLAHNEKGRPSYDFANNQRMHEKRCQKLAPLRDRDELVRVFGRKESRKGIVAFGSTAQFVLETVDDLGLQDKLSI